jgi:hypothetical protein
MNMRNIIMNGSEIRLPIGGFNELQITKKIVKYIPYLYGITVHFILQT